MERPELVDRERELDDLERLADGQPRIAVLYGRRRVGKTYLLAHAWPREHVFYYLAADLTPDLNRRELLSELATWSRRGFSPEDYPTWRAVLRAIGGLAREGQLIVVLDEFQYLCRGPDDIRSQLAAVFDRDLVGLPILIVACGSVASIMEEVARGPLFGRVSWTARLHPFDYWDAARMLPGRSLRERARFYGVFGGTPRYLAAILPQEELGSAVARTLLSPRGELFQQLDTLIEQEQAIRKPEEYNSVLGSIGRGHHTVAAISGHTGLEAATVRQVLDRLEHDLEYVYRERNFGAPSRAPFSYRIADPALAFWQALVAPRRTRLEFPATDPMEVWKEIEPRLETHMGHVFERICLQAFQRHHRTWGLAGAPPWSRWEGTDRNRRPIEIDLISRLDDGGLLVGEIKWGLQPAGPGLHQQLCRDLEDLGRSGQGWARDAGAADARYLYICAGGFTPEMRELAQRDPRIRLVDLTDVYAGLPDTGR